MKVVAIKVDDTAKDQIMTFTIEPNGRSVTLRLQLTWREYVNKWFATLWNASNDECLLSNFPIVVSQTTVNDLLGQFGYKLIGTFCCVALTDEAQGIDPTFDTMSLYELLWGDHIG